MPDHSLSACPPAVAPVREEASPARRPCSRSTRWTSSQPARRSARSHAVQRSSRPSATTSVAELARDTARPPPRPPRSSTGRFRARSRRQAGASPSTRAALVDDSREQAAPADVQQRKRRDAVGTAEGDRQAVGGEQRHRLARLVPTRGRRSAPRPLPGVTKPTGCARVTRAPWHCHAIVARLASASTASARRRRFSIDLVRLVVRQQAEVERTEVAVADPADRVENADPVRTGRVPVDEPRVRHRRSSSMTRVTASIRVAQERRRTRRGRR